MPTAILNKTPTSDPVQSTARRNIVPVHQTSAGERVKVKFIGDSASYTLGNMRWTKNGPSQFVTLEQWKSLKKERAKHTGRRLFMVDVDDDENAQSDPEIVEQELKQATPGNFVTKDAALEYAADFFEVCLSRDLSLLALNQQISEMQVRFSVGKRGWALIEGIRKAAPVEGAEDFLPEVEEEYVTVPAQQAAVEDNPENDGEDDAFETPPEQKAQEQAFAAPPTSKGPSMKKGPESKIRQV